MRGGGFFPTRDSRPMSEKRVIFRGTTLPLLLLAPQLAVTVVFFLYPAAQAVRQSMFRSDAFGFGERFVGFSNFSALLNSSRYWDSVGVTAVFAPAVAGILWWFLFNPSIGILAYVLRTFGIRWDQFVNGDHALILVIISASWAQISYNFIFFLAGLQSIPRSIMEAAAIDGAGPVKRFFTITLPLLSPTVFFLSVINVVYAFFDTFAIIDTTTAGGPGRDTTTLVYSAYSDGFLGQNFGSSAAQSVLLTAVVMVLTIVQFRFVERRVHY
jgi:sn-glycerol 3-phosphate transport system permease protein